MHIYNFKINAFSLAETLIVITVLGILAAIAVTSLVKSYQKLKQ